MRRKTRQQGVVRRAARRGLRSGVWLKPETWLKAVMVVAGLLLIGLPVLADAINAVLRPMRGDEGNCRILSVIDGDTVVLWCLGTAPERARLTGFDAPELFSPQCFSEQIAAERAKWALRGMVFSADRIELSGKGRDRYDRRLIAVTVDGQPLALRMIRAGHARAYDGGRRQGWCDEGGS